MKLENWNVFCLHCYAVLWNLEFAELAVPSTCRFTLNRHFKTKRSAASRLCTTTLSTQRALRYKSAFIHSSIHRGDSHDPAGCHALVGRRPPKPRIDPRELIRNMMWREKRLEPDRQKKKKKKKDPWLYLKTISHHHSPTCGYRGPSSHSHYSTHAQS